MWWPIRKKLIPELELTVHNTNTNGALVREQAGNTLKSAEPGESGHRTVGVCTTGNGEIDQRSMSSIRRLVGLTLQNTNTPPGGSAAGALVREQAGNTLKSAEPGESGHRTVGVCGGSAPATNKSGHGEAAAAANSIRRLVGPVGLEPTLART